MPNKLSAKSYYNCIRASKRIYSIFRRCFIHLSSLAFLIRAIGLESVNTLLRALFSRWDTPESPKPVLQKSFWIALSRCPIHLFPVSVLTFLLWINYRGYYIGPGFSALGDNKYIALYQVAAKLQEVLCVASLATVVLQFLRSDLLYGEGVPIGLLGSGISFSSVSYFWSLDFISAARYCLSSSKRCRLYFIVILAGLLASQSGLLLRFWVYHVKGQLQSPKLSIISMAQPIDFGRAP